MIATKPRWAPAPYRPRLGNHFLAQMDVATRWQTFILLEAAGIGSLVISYFTQKPLKTVSLIGGVGLIGIGLAQLLAGKGYGAEDPITADPERTGPLEVTIDGETYLVNGDPITLDHILELAAARKPESGPHVIIYRSESSRAVAEADLTRALIARGLTFQFRNLFARRI